MKIGVALSGGGVRGAAHVGMLMALEKAGIKVSCISGTSSGSIVAALYAVGYTPNEIKETFLQFDSNEPDSTGIRFLDFDYMGMAKLPLCKLFGRPVSLKGLVKGDKLEEIFRTMFLNKNVLYISNVKIPLAVPAVDIDTGKTVMFVSDRNGFEDCKNIIFEQEADLAFAIRASIAFPGIFRPVNYGGRMLCDGGITSNLPDDVLSGFGADKVIAMNLGFAGKREEPINNLFEIAGQSVNILTYQVTKQSMGKNSFVINPNIYDVSLLDAKQIDAMIERGYKATIDSLSDIIKFLKE